VDDHILAGQQSFLVRDGNRLVGLLTLHHVKEIPRSKWSATTASEAAIPAEEMKTVGPGEDLWTAMEKMDRDGVNQLPVMDDNKVLGILRREDLISYLRILHEMGPGGDEPQRR
jgi:CBS domain-containing protein